MEDEKWENFAKVGCKNSKLNVDDHFAGVRKMVAIQKNYFAIQTRK